MPHRFLFALAPLALGACAHHPVDVSIRAAVIGPADWDGSGSARPVIAQAAITSFAQVDPLLTAVSVQVSDRVLAAFGPPDVTGTAVVFKGGAAVGSPVAIPRVSDSFGPTWPKGTVLLQNVPLEHGAVVEVSLLDYDILNDDDPIARVQINRNQLKAALRAEAPTWINFEAVTGGALLRLAIEVDRAERR